MQINLNKKEFYKKIVLYFKKELIGTQYKEHETDDHSYFAIEKNCNINSFSFWYYKKGADSFWASSCVLYAFLADCGRWNDGSGRKVYSGRPEYLFCPTGGFCQCNSF